MAKRLTASRLSSRQRSAIVVVIALCAIAAVVMVGLDLISDAETEADLKTRAQDQLLVSTAAQQLAASLDRRHHHLEVIAAESRGEKRVDPADLVGRLRQLEPNDLAEVLDASGRVIASSDPQRIGRAQSGESWFVVPSRSAGVLHQVVPGKSAEGRKESSVIHAVMLPDPETGAPAFVLVSYADVADLIRELGDDPSLRNATAVQSDGLVLSAGRTPDGSRCFGCHSPNEMLRRVGSRAVGTIEHTGGATQGQTLSFARMDFAGRSAVLILPGRVPGSVLLARTHGRIVGLIALVVLVVIMAGMAIFRMSRQTLRARIEAEEWKEKSALESALRTAEQHFRTIVESSHDLIWILDSASRITYVNPRMVEVSGYEADEIHGRALVEIMADESRALTGLLLATVIDAGAGDAEVVMTSRSGGRVILDLTAVSVGQGPTGAVICSGHDLTNRRKAEETARNQERRFRQLIDATPGIVWSADAQTVQFTFVSEKSFEILGYEPKEWLAPTFWVDHLHPDDREWAPRFCVEQTRLGVAHSFEYRMIAADGRVVWLHDVVNVEVVDGAARTLFGVMIDITRSKEAELGIRRLATAIEHAGEAVIVTDRRGLIEYANPAFETITGYSRSEAIGQRPAILKSGMHDQAFYQAVWQQITSGRPWAGKIVNRRKDGALYEAETTISPIFAEGETVTGFVAVQRDITEKVILLEKLRRAEENESFGRLVSGVAHEVRNPLAAIQASLAALQLDFSEDSEHAPFFDIIRQQVERLSRLMREMLELAKPLQVSRVAAVVAADVCASSIAMWRHANPDEPMSRIQFRSRTATAVRMDAARMQQVIVNLLDNATQHSARDTTVIVEVDDVPEGCRISVRDSGTGIQEVASLRLFEPFFTTRRGGTGLGLSLVRKIVEQHDGRVTLFNNLPAAGATAEIILPAVPVEPEVRA